MASPKSSFLLDKDLARHSQRVIPPRIINFPSTNHILCVVAEEPVRFTYWARGHPKAFLHSLRDCVRMVRKSSWKWHETPCSALKWKYRFICQYGQYSWYSCLELEFEYIPKYIRQ